MRYLHGSGRGRAGGRRSFWAAWLVTSAGHAGRDDLCESTLPRYFDLGARAEFLLLLLADIVVRAVGVIGEQIVDLGLRCRKLICAQCSGVSGRRISEHPCNPDVYDKFRGFCALDNCVRCTRTAIFHLTRVVARLAPRPVPSSMYVSKAYCRGGCCSSGRGVLNEARRSSENLAAPLDRYASLNQSLSSGRNEPMYWRPGSTLIHSTRRSREVT